MKSLRFSPLHRAVAGCFATAACAAHAVFLSPDGTGQALVYPYYTVQSANGNAFNTYLSVVNTTTRAKAVKVRFLEGRNGRKALDFNLYLSPNDVWTAALGPQDATDQSPAVLATADKSCTSPPIPAGGVDFRNFYYVGPRADGGPPTLDRTREGYFEVIEMATLAGAAATAVTHLSSGVPSNCAFVQPENGFRAGSNDAYLRPPNGGLMGTYTLINVANGLNFAGNATALGALFANPNFADTDSLTPNLASADPFASTVVPNGSGSGMVGYRATYGSGRDAVSATLMKTSIFNEYALEPGTRSATDVVMTFPTKPFYVNGGTNASPFSTTFGATGACEPVNVTFFNREMQPTRDGAVITLPPPPSPFAGACWTAQVFSITPTAQTVSRSLVLGSTNFAWHAVDGYVFGWVAYSFTGAFATQLGVSSSVGLGSAVDLAANRSLPTTTVVHKGLPVIGFAARTLNNGLLSCATFGGASGTCVGSYGLLTDHRYTSSTSPTP